MNTLYVLAVCYLFISFGAFILFHGVSFLLRVKINNTTIAKRIGYAKTRISDASDSELLYEYFVEARPYYLVAVPGDVIEDSLYISYNPLNPKDVKIYCKEDIVSGAYFCTFGFIIMFTGLLSFIVLMMIM